MRFCVFDKIPFGGESLVTLRTLEGSLASMHWHDVDLQVRQPLVSLVASIAPIFRSVFVGFQMLSQMVGPIVFASTTYFRTFKHFRNVIVQELMVFQVRLQFENALTAVACKRSEVNLKRYTWGLTWWRRWIVKLDSVLSFFGQRHISVTKGHYFMPLTWCYNVRDVLTMKCEKLGCSVLKSPLLTRLIRGDKKVGSLWFTVIDFQSDTWTFNSAN